jgi:transposase InsO family protein
MGEGQVIKNLLDRLYKDVESPASFGGVEQLWQMAREFHPKVTRSQVEQYLAKEPTYTTHRRAVRKFERLITQAPGPNTIWQADLGVLQMLERQNSGYAYYLLCIDCFTRMLHVEPLRKKTAEDVIEAFRRVFKRAGSIPWKIITDQGKEFVAKSVQTFFKRRQILHYCNYTSPVFHAGMAERANRTLKERLYRYFTEKDTKKWVDIIQKLVVSINASPHRSIGGLAPDMAHLFAPQLRRHFQRVHEKKVQRAKRRAKRAPPLKVGQHVRIEKRKDIFQKGYKPNFSQELFTVFTVRPSAPTTYGLVDSQGERIRGWFYREDLCPVATRPREEKIWEVAKVLDHKTVVDFTKGRPTEMLLVKWKGLDEGFNSWIPARNLAKK